MIAADDAVASHHFYNQVGHAAVITRRGDRDGDRDPSFKITFDRWDFESIFTFYRSTLKAVYVLKDQRAACVGKGKIDKF